MLKFNNAVDNIEEINDIIFKDVLTCVNNKLAFDEFKKSYNNEKIAIVMADINNLKYINDSYGPDKGDEYIKGCCKIFCNVYKKSPIYRTGGDEFIAVLKGDDYINRHELYNDVQWVFNKVYHNNKIEWKRFSMAVGMTDHIIDESITDTINRADKEMYKNKETFKKVNGTYR